MLEPLPYTVYMKRYTDDEMRNAVANNTSIRQVLIALGLASQGGNYRTVHRAVDRMGLDTSHFTGKGWSAGKNLGPARPIEDYLSNDFPITSHKLRLRLLKEGLFEHKCYSCDNIDWLGKPIPLELEHIDGVHSNNNIENLTLLCPNCHAQTLTYRGKNQKRAQKSA